ncbi:MAG: hypothetical protein NVS3B20_11770 [Polyangiales bacterium]
MMKRVLLVDDDEAILECLEGLLCETYEIVLARDGIEALEVIRSRPVDAVVLDLMMPRMDGAGLKRALDDLRICVPIVIASAGTQVEKSARSLGVEDFLKKPFDIEELEGKLARLVNMSSPSTH